MPCLMALEKIGEFIRDEHERIDAVLRARQEQVISLNKAGRVFGGRIDAQSARFAGSTTNERFEQHLESDRLTAWVAGKEIFSQQIQFVAVCRRELAAVLDPNRFT